jgi:amino acid adenylation domain-containing protein
MTSLDLTAVISLLKRAGDLDIKISLEHDELVVKVNKDKKPGAPFLEELRENKDRLVRYFRQYAAAHGSSLTSILPAITPRKHDAHIPLSFGQERLLFLHRLQADQAYNMPWVARITGALNVVALEAGFREIIDRHEVLRTVVKEQEGVSYQIINSAEQWRMEVITGDEIREKGYADNEKYIAHLLQQLFDLSADYTLKVTLIKMAADDYILIARAHHIAFDGWSISILVKELTALYENSMLNQGEVLSALPVQYGDYAIWQRAYLSGNILAAKLDYWRKQLSDVTPLILPSDHPLPFTRSSGGGRIQRIVSDAKRDQLLRFSQQEGVTLFMTLLGAFKVLLYRYSGQIDICVGTSVAGRQQQETEGLIGFFVNTLAIRSEVNEQLSFRAFLQDVKATMLRAYDHQDVPFEKVVEAVGVKRDLRQHPIVQVVFTLQNTPEVDELRLGEVQVTPLVAPEVASKFDLNLDITVTPEGLVILFTYSSDLYEAATIERMAGHYENILQSILQQPDLSLSALPLLAPAEENVLLEQFNHTDIGYSGNQSIKDLFDAQVLKTPEATALVFQDERLTYRELDIRSNQLGYLLRDKGVIPGMLVPVCLERSADLIVAILGILKAGAAYVPLDPSYPAERVKYMLENCAATLFITMSKHLGMGIEDTDIIRINIDEDRDILSRQPTGNMGVVVTTDMLAYVMYTSGSTGTPKGVMVDHGNVVSLVEGVSCMDLSADSILLSTGSPSFDATTLEYWGMLLNGGCLVMCSQQVLLDIVLLKALIVEMGVTAMWFTSGWFNQLVETDISILAPLKTIVVGGDRLSPHHINQVRSYYPLLTIINGYGPTENTTFSLMYNIAAIDGIKEIPIGRPLCNRSAYILDSHGKLCPPGVMGELYVGGAGLSRGYLHLPELTAGKFVADHFHPLSGARLYRTGDLARWLPDGNVEFLGRKDEQVKIRGYRIELGEIMQVMQKMPGIGQAIVLVHENGQQKQLIAFVTVTSDGFKLDELLSALQQRLPSYMIPVAIQEINEVPLTNNGKVDRKQLLELFIQPVTIQAYEAPRNPAESAMAAIWEELLGIARVGIHDDFFELGGHSLLAMRLAAMIRKQTGKEVAIKNIFLYSTVAALSKHLQEQGERMVPANIMPRTGNAPVRLSFAQERLWFIDQLQGSTQYHLPWLFRLTGTLEIPVLEAAFREIVNRHEVLRTVIREENGIGYQVITPRDQWKLQYSDLADIPDAGLQGYVEQQINRPFDLSADSMLKVFLIRISDDEYIMVGIVHHIVFDGWSISILVRELVELYTAGINNRPAVLPLLPVQYADYAIWQRGYLTGEGLSTKLDYWKQQLNNIVPLAIQTDYPRPAVLSTNGAMAVRMLDKSLHSSLANLSGREGVTLFMTMLAAFKVVLYRYSGQSDITVGSVVAGRQQHEVEGLIGFFINTLALRSHIREDINFAALLQEVKEMTLDAYEHQDVPFEKVVEALGIERDLSRTPVFQVVFTLQNAPSSEALSLGPVQLSMEAAGSITSKFDLNLEVMEFSDGLRLALTYCKDLFNEGTANRLLDHYENLLEAIATNIDRPIADLPILAADETRQLIYDYTNTYVSYPGDQTTISLFEAQVLKTPDAIAVIFGTEQVTYREIDERANRLAHYLQKLGVKEEVLVPLCIQRSITMVVGILGILKAGGAYIPVDPDYPAARIDLILKDTMARFVLADAATEDLLPEDITVISFDSHWAQISLQSSEKPENPPSPHELAYIIYTSGSTGNPKGVMIEHSQLLNYVLNGISLYGTNETGNAGSFLHLSYTFDASLTALFVPLLQGRSLVLATGRSVDVFEEAALLQHAPYDFIKLTPAHLPILESLLGADGVGRLTKKIVVGGEALHTKHIRFLTDAGADLEIINEYGPTETTVG